MADEKLLEALTSGIRGGMTEEQVKEKLVNSGWNKNDVNGAYALHILSQKPIGSNLITAWRKTQDETKASFLAQLIRTLGFVGLLIITAVVVDWNGYIVPPLEKYTIRSYIESKVDPSYLPQVVRAEPTGTTTPEGL